MKLAAWSEIFSGAFLIIILQQLTTCGKICFDFDKLVTQMGIMGPGVTFYYLNRLFLPRSENRASFAAVLPLKPKILMRRSPSRVFTFPAHRRTCCKPWLRPSRSCPRRSKSSRRMGNSYGLWYSLATFNPMVNRCHRSHNGTASRPRASPSPNCER